jgi:Na+-translocating ferredoxin:NAD+ oxidoreductase subunit B
MHQNRNKKRMTLQPVPAFAPDSPYRRLARSLDSLPHRFPPADDESDLRLLANIFTPEQAALAAELLPVIETPAQIAERLGRDPREIMAQLKEMSKQGLIAFGKTEQGRPGFGLMPFVVGIYEEQGGRIDAEFAQLFEQYYQQAFGEALKLQPQVHRVIPIGESIKNNMEVHPYESASMLVDQSNAWGVVDCICRKQKALIGDPCDHPVDICLVFSRIPDAFASSTTVRSLDRAGALQTLQRAAAAGLVHCVSNNQRDLWYVCNCCTCSCSILRGMADLGIANVVARSAFVNQVDVELCLGCGECQDACQFTAITVNGTAQVNEVRCVGCGVCVPVCPQEAMVLVRRLAESEPPVSDADWRAARDH